MRLENGHYRLYIQECNNIKNKISVTRKLGYLCELRNGAWWWKTLWMTNSYYNDPKDNLSVFMSPESDHRR